MKLSPRMSLRRTASCYSPSIHTARARRAEKSGPGPSFSPVFPGWKWVKGLATACCILVLATGCTGGEEVDPTSPKVRLHRLQVDDKELLCVVYHGAYGGGLDCDWEGWR